MRITNKTTAGLFCFLLVTVTACEAKEPAASSPYPVHDSGTWADPFGSADLYWLDNHRVIFRSVQDNDKRRVTSGPFNLSIWEIGKGVSIYTKNVTTVQGLLGRFCYNGDGMIFYPLAEKDAQGNEQYKYGEFGKEKLFTRPKNAKTILEAMNCRVLDVDTMMKERKGRRIRPLLERHGYLDTGANRGPESNENIPIMFFKPDGSSVKLAARQFELNSLIGYFPFKEAYLFMGSLESGRPTDIANLWPPGTRQIFTWLHPDGRIEPLIIPAEPWPDKKVPNFGFIGALMPVKNGYVFPFGKAKGPKDAGNTGPHLLRNGKIVKILGGYYSSPAVSPDGCQVAFVHFPYSDATIARDPAPIRLKAVNLCPN